MTFQGQLEEYIKAYPKITLVRAPERVGLIRCNTSLTLIEYFFLTVLLLLTILLTYSTTLTNGTSFLQYFFLTVLLTYIHLTYSTSLTPR